MEQWISSRYAENERVVGLDTEWTEVEKTFRKKKAIMKVAMH